MALRKKFTRTLKGKNRQVITGLPIAITTDATLALFIANAPTGEIGVYDALDAIHSNAITAAESFYIVLKKSDGSIKRTTLLKWSDVSVVRKAYVAPVKATGSFGWSGTAGGLNLLAAPVAGNNYEFAVIETTEGNDPFPTWNYEYTAMPGDTEASIVNALAKMVNDYNSLQYKSNAPLVVATVKASGTYGNLALGAASTLTLTNGSDVAANSGTIDVAVGDYVSFNGAAAPTNAVGDVYRVTEIITANTFRLNRPYGLATQIFTEAEAEGTRVKRVTDILQSGLVLTAINAQEHFRIINRQELRFASTVNLSAYTYGNGTPEQIQELELEGNTFDGNTAGNTQYGNEKYGNPDTFARSNGDTETYDSFNIFASQLATLVSPPAQGRIPMELVLAVPKSAGGLSAALNTLFGT